MDDERENEGIVYALTNPAMPDLVKIGKTTRENVEQCLCELYNTGVPVPFECAYAGRVVDESKVERAFHQAFSPYRLYPKRESFQIQPEQSIALLSILASEDVTPNIQGEADSIDRDAKDNSEKLKNRRPPLNYLEMNIPIGSTLYFLNSPHETAIVCSERKIEFRGKKTSLTAATRELLALSYSVAPGQYWTYNGTPITEIYKNKYTTYD